MYINIRGVKVFSWNPRMLRGRPVVRRGTKVSPWNRVDNFGDSLGPLVVGRMVENLPPGANGSGRLFTVGSVMHLASRGSVVWGTGLRRPDAFPRHGFVELDIRAVRGPITEAAVLRAGGSCPSIFGDPGLLLPQLFPEFGDANGGSIDGDVLIVPNLNDSSDYSEFGRVINPCSSLSTVVKEIRSSSFVTGTSLHAGILADAYGVPNRIAVPDSETLLKYEDYYEGTGRLNQALGSVRSCMDAGPGERLEMGLAKLLDSFPRDMWD